VQLVHTPDAEAGMSARVSSSSNSSKAQAPKAESSKAESPKVETPKAQAPKVESKSVSTNAPATPKPANDVFGQGAAADKSKAPSTPPALQKALDALPPEAVEAEDIKALNDRLAKMEPAARDAEVKFLTEHVLDEANPGRAVNAYLELKQLQEVRPDRLTNDIVHTLTQGVAEARSTGAAGSEGILGVQQATDAARTLMQMSDSDFKHLQGALDGAGKRDGKLVPGADPQAERALLLEAATARMDELSKPSAADKARIQLGQPSEPMEQILSYASQVAGMQRKDLIEQSTVLDLDAGSDALQQRFTDSCVPTSQQMARAEVDPIYARQLHQEAIHSLDHNTDIGREQKQWLEEGGGIAKPRDPREPGGRGMMPETIINDFLGPYTNRTYTKQVVQDTAASRTAALDRAEELLQNGVDVPIGVYWNGGGGHAMLFTDVRGEGDNRQFLLTDPWHGQTAWVSAKDIVAGNTNFLAGTGRLGLTYE
jgi:hypothetical protein